MPVILVNCPMAKGRMRNRRGEVEVWLLWKLIKISYCENKKQTRNNPLSSKIQLGNSQVVAYWTVGRWHPIWAGSLYPAGSCALLPPSKLIGRLRSILRSVKRLNPECLDCALPFIPFWKQVSYHLVKCFSRQRLKKSWQWRYSRSAGDVIGVWKLQCLCHRQHLMGFAVAARVFEA